MNDDELTANAFEAFRHFDRRESAVQRTHLLKEWALSLFCWDGVLPIAVFTIPSLLKVLLPNWVPAFAILAVFGPVIALSIRFVIGWARMRTGRAYAWQMVLFIVAISALFLFEAFILNDQFGGGPKIAEPTVLLGMFIVYMTMMAIALFPIREIIFSNS